MKSIKPIRGVIKQINLVVLRYLAGAFELFSCSLKTIYKITKKVVEEDIQSLWFSNSYPLRLTERTKSALWKDNAKNEIIKIKTGVAKQIELIQPLIILGSKTNKLTNPK